jgi:hypothetical protein
MDGTETFLDATFLDAHDTVRVIPLPFGLVLPTTVPTIAPPQTTDPTVLRVAHAYKACPTHARDQFTRAMESCPAHEREEFLAQFLARTSQPAAGAHPASFGVHGGPQCLNFHCSSSSTTCPCTSASSTGASTNTSTVPLR